jgi:HEAT repeat protein
LYAVEALGKLGSARAITPLLEVANDPSRDRVRSAAKIALTRLGWQNDIVEPRNSAPEDHPATPTHMFEEI